MRYFFIQPGNRCRSHRHPTQRDAPLSLCTLYSDDRSVTRSARLIYSLLRTRFSLRVPRNFFSLFFFSLRCLRAVLVTVSASPILMSLCLGSISLAFSTESYTRQNAVDLPPP